MWDNGVGLRTGFDLERAATLGLRLVRILARRLEATITIEHSPGACFTFAFPRHADAPVEPQ